MSRQAAPAFLPDRSQELLLHACLLPADLARAAYDTWSACVNVEALDGGSILLMPLLAARQHELGISDARFGRFRGVQRLAWVKNQQLLRELRAALQVLAAERPLLLKGVALVGDIYPQRAARPIGDLDLLVRREQAPTAIRHLMGSGWRPVTAVPRTRADFAIRKSLALASPAVPGVELDLHWRLLDWREAPAGEAALRAAATPSSAYPDAMTPVAADLLLHVLAHGARWNPLPPIRWVADATMILRTGEVDWGHFVAQVRRFDLPAPVGATLRYLVARMAAIVPATVLAEIATVPSKRIARTAVFVDQRAFDDRRFADAFALHWHRARTLVGWSPAALWSYFSSMRGARSAPDTVRWLSRRVRQ